MHTISTTPDSRSQLLTYPPLKLHLSSVGQVPVRKKLKRSTEATATGDYAGGARSAIVEQFTQPRRLDAQAVQSSKPCQLRVPSNQQRLSCRFRMEESSLENRATAQQEAVDELFQVLAYKLTEEAFSNRLFYAAAVQHPRYCLVWTLR